MSGPRGTASIDGDANAAVRRVFEASGHGESRSKLAVDLRLGCTGTNCTPCDQICGVLGADCIKEFTPRGEAHFRDIKQKRTSDAKSAVNLEGAIHVWIVDKPFPSDGCTGLLEVDTHDDVEIIFCGFGIRPQFLCILNSGIDVVN